MIEKIILYTIITIVVSTAFAFLTKATGKSVETDESGKFNLRMNKLYGILGLIGLVFGLLFLIFVTLTAEPNDRGIWIGVILMFTIFWGTGIPCLMYYRNHKVTFSDNAIVATNVYGKMKEIKWNDISDIRFKALSGLLILTTQSEQIKVHRHLVGLSKFVEFIETKTKWTSEELKVPTGKK
jgi:amino acid transporter